MAEECSYSDKQEKVEMRGEENEEKEGVCEVSSISNLAHHIPFDLTVEILTRLPARSLKRFQCVSKEWLSTIQDQGFIDSFNSMSQTRSRFLVAVCIAENRVSLLSSSHNETERRPATCLVPNLERHGFISDSVYSTCLHTNLEMTMSGYLVHCSSVHGFIGLSHPSDPGRFTVCNPSTRQVITLPDIKASSVYMYVGYDPVGNEYKALCSRILCGETERYQEHKVLTLGGGNLSWRDITGRRTPRYNVVTNGICINGMVYYVGMTQRREKQPRVFCFDVRGERMSYIKPPLTVITRGSLINYNGKLGAAYPLPYDPHCRFDILVLEDVDKGIWSRQQFCFHPLLWELSGKIQLKILGLNKTNQIILGPQKLPPKYEPLYIFYYEIGGLSNEFIRRVKLEGFEEFGCNHTVDDHCVCQVFFSPEHFENLSSL